MGPRIRAEAAALAAHREALSEEATNARRQPKRARGLSSATVLMVLLASGSAGVLLGFSFRRRPQQLRLQATPAPGRKALRVGEMDDDDRPGGSEVLQNTLGHGAQQQMPDAEAGAAASAGTAAAATASAAGDGEGSVGQDGLQTVAVLKPAAYVMVSFRNGKALGDGLRLLHSTDGFTWERLSKGNSSFVVLPLQRLAGANVFRDPSAVWHQGAFHLVFTTDLCVQQVPGKWECRGAPAATRPQPRFGYATSTDLVHWSDVRFVTVDLPDACSLWAPEIAVRDVDDGGGFLVVFSATRSAGRCPRRMVSSKHEPFWMSSADMRTFSKPQPMQLPADDASVIDLFPLLWGAPAPALAANGSSDAGRLVLFYKAERNVCPRFEWRLGGRPGERGSCSLVIRQARAHSIEGPWTIDESATGSFFPNAISRPCVEGPSALHLASGQWMLLFDQYRTDCPFVSPEPCGVVAGQPVQLLGLQQTTTSARGKCRYTSARQAFGALLSDSLGSWRDLSGNLHAPGGYKHGTAMKLGERALHDVCSARGSPFRQALICKQRTKRD